MKNYSVLSEKYAISETLIALLKHTKKSTSTDNWKVIRDQVLADIYHSDMRFRDVFCIVFRAYDELVKDKRFQSGYHSTEDLVLAPIVGTSSLNMFGSRLEDMYSIEEFYSAIMQHMISAIHLSRVDWCREIFDE